MDGGQEVMRRGFAPATPPAIVALGRLVGILDVAIR
jgi:hypothetical protein